MSEYCLRWNNHRPNLVTVFSELLTSEALVDVTLATDGHFIHAHKLVLSACSVYFKDLFGANPCKHPIVILKDIRIEDLRTVIDFIYRGEVNVAQDRLQDVLRTAESLRIKGLAENPRSYDELSSHGARFTSSSFGSSQVTRQKSSLTDSREQSLSIEGEEEGEPGSPPSSKKRKITSHDSSESIQEETENEERVQPYNVKDEPADEQENDKTASRDTDQESTMGVSQDGGDEGSTAPGTSSDPAQATSHSQGRNKRGVLQRQQVITRDGGGEERREEGRELLIQHQQPLKTLQLGQELVRSEVKHEPGKGDPDFTELIVPDTTVMITGTSVSITSSQPTLLQVPTMVLGPRDSPGLGHLPKQHSHPTPILTSAPILGRQLSHPERSRQNQQGPPPLSKQQSQPSVLTHTSTTSPLTTTTTTTNTTASPAQSHLKVIPVFMKQRPSPATLASQSAQLRPIQPKPPGEGLTTPETTPKKDVPLIRLTPSEDGANANISAGYTIGACSVTGPPRLPPRAASEEPAMTRTSMTHTTELLAPGQSVLMQSISQDSSLDVGMSSRMLNTSQLAVTTASPVRSTSSPGHCPVLRGGPALGCNYCWNSTDPQGRVLRRKTKYHCPECRTNLCIVPCFHEYHKQIERVQDTDKQITKILTKTGSV